MAEYIDKQAFLANLNDIYANMAGFHPQFYNGYQFAVNALREFPTADVSEVRPELRKAAKLLEKNYERGLNGDYVRNPLAWALYQTWKEIDGRC